ncbi:MAG: MarR family transcriptional regulator [Paracoccaceae bacterium]
MPVVIDPDHIFYILFDISKLNRAEFERRIAGAGLDLTPAEARVLGSLLRRGPLRQHEIARRLDIGKMNLTKIIDRLEARGLVARSEAPDDRRAKIVTLTDAADPTLQTIARITSEIRQAGRGALSAEEWESFHRLARTTRENLAALAQQTQGERE